MTFEVEIDPFDGTWPTTPPEVRQDVETVGDLVTDAVAVTLANQVEYAIIQFGNTSQRSLQSKQHVLGVSDIGGCREFVRRMILNEPFSDEVNEYALASFVGHAVGEYAERAVMAVLEGGQRQLTVSIALENGVVLHGHPDLVLPDMCIDFKTVDGLAVVKKGSKSQHHWQVILYTAALIKDGTLPENALCALVYLDRSGKEVRPHVEVWRYDPTLLEPIVEWVDDVLYAVGHDEEASKDKPREFCWAACPYVTDCRGGDTDVTGLITDEEQLLAVKAYKDASGRFKAAKRDRDTASDALRGVNGSTGEDVVRWVNVPEQTIEAFNRREYQRLSITKAPSRRAPSSD
jgi:hypothetical protein